MFGYEGVGQILLRLIVLFGAALLVVRLMGNRTVGQLSPFDFVIMVGIGDIIITASMDKNSTLMTGVEGLVALLVLQQILSRLALKSVTLRKWFEGKPVVLVQDGKLLKENFIKTQFNYDDLRQELHRQGLDISNLQDIKLGRLESCGTFSVIKVADAEPITRRDFKDFFQQMHENPLSQAGVDWGKIEQFMNDMRYLTEKFKQQETIMAENSQSTGTSNTKELH
ncbi:Hypothetical protein LUCI_4049 [Lucifera butyrica]|uniref:YetF C-terminal domain-containing protein n=1 Tax=Lucifera butyrica TaxID=1351585 RepID=A0A498RI37_9FIRM|nr:YetF domain-containing protein [Lucifera butyrica]VBB08768.1 Hypothetical protein LUCI_4049 [Lucifera butyrica]